MDAVESECGYTSHPMCLWTPPIDALSDVSTRIGQFCQQVQQKHNIKFSTYKDLHKWSINNYGLFWEECWHYFDVIHSAPYDEVIDKSKSISDIPEWFTGSRLNFAENMLRFRDDRVAVYAVSEGAYTVRRRTYAELYADVTRLASAMKALGIQQGDRVVGYIPNSIEAVVAMLAAASIGAVWSSTSPDFGVFGVLERFTQIQPSLIFSINAVTYNGKVHPHLEKLQQVVQGLPDLKKVVIIPHSKQGNDKIDLSNITNGCLYEDFCKLGDNNCSELEFRQLPFNHPLYIMYSSGTTGVPKCMVHSAGGTLMKHLEEHILQSNMTRNDVMLYYTTTGWMMWNWYVSVLAVGGTIVCYDGSPLVPHINVIWDLVDNLKVTILGTSAKWLSALQEKGTSPGKTHSLKTLRTILSTGSPLKPASYDYVYNEIKSDVLLGSITGGTDIIACFAGNNATVPVYRGEIQSAHLGCAIESWNEDGKAVSGESGELVCLKPFPSMPTHFWNDANGEKYQSAYFRKFEGVWAHGDYCLINENTGGIWMLGRSDGTLNPGGVRFGSAEVYHVVESFKEIQDSLCIGQKSRDGCDERVVLFLKMVPGFAFSAEIVKQIQLTIRKELTPRHVPSLFLEIADIPYTHSGKKVEIAVKKILNGEDVKSRSAYANPDSLDLYYNIPLLQNY